MTITIRELHPGFVGEVDGVDLRQPLTADEVAVLEAGMDRHAVLVYHDQDITDEQQLAFTRNFGEIELAIGGNITAAEDRRLPTEFADVSNLGREHEVLERDDRRHLFNLGNRLWHSDSSFRAVPAKYSLLSARVIPGSGGNTEFADMRAAYEALDERKRAQVDDLVCEHSLIYSRSQLGFTEFTAAEREQFAPVRQALVRTHPVSGRRSLFLASHAGAIVGWPMPEARIFLRDLVEHATAPGFVHVHRWRPHDLVMWDNRQTMHRARALDDPGAVRDVRRTTLRCDGPTAAQAA